MPIVLETVHLMLRTSMKVFIGSVQVHLERLNKLLIVCFIPCCKILRSNLSFAYDLTLTVDPP